MSRYKLYDNLCVNNMLLSYSKSHVNRDTTISGANNTHGHHTKSILFR